MIKFQRKSIIFGIKNYYVIVKMWFLQISSKLFNTSIIILFLRKFFMIIGNYLFIYHSGYLENINCNFVKIRKLLYQVLKRWVESGIGKLSSTSYIAFTFVLIPLGKAWSYLFLLRVHTPKITLQTRLRLGQ